MIWQHNARPHLIPQKSHVPLLLRICALKWRGRGDRLRGLIPPSPPSAVAPPPPPPPIFIHLTNMQVTSVSLLFRHHWMITPTQAKVKIDKWELKCAGIGGDYCWVARSLTIIGRPNINVHTYWVHRYSSMSWNKTSSLETTRTSQSTSKKWGYLGCFWTSQCGPVFSSNYCQTITPIHVAELFFVFVVSQLAPDKKLQFIHSLHSPAFSTTLTIPG